MGNPLVSLFDQSLGGSSSVIVKINHYGRDSHVIVSPVEKYNRQPSFDHVCKMGIVHRFLGYGNQYSINSSGQQGFNTLHFMFVRFIGLIDENVISVGIGNRLNAMDNGSKKIYFRTGDDHPDHMGFAAS